MKNCRVNCGDTVEIFSGDAKGKKGKVLQVFSVSNRVTVEGLNLVKRHVKRSGQNTEGGIVEREAPIHVSNLKVLEKGARKRRSKS